MSKPTQIPSDAATKQAVVAYAAERGISQTKALAELVHLTLDAEPESPFFRLGLRLGDEPSQRLSQMALERSQSPVETLAAALDALAPPSATDYEDGWKAGQAAAFEKLREGSEAIKDAYREGLSPPLVQPAAKGVPVAPDGGAYCKCDGEWQNGPWHRSGCERRTP